MTRLLPLSVFAVIGLSAVAWPAVVPSAAAGQDRLEGTWTAQYAGRRGEAADTSRVYLQFSHDRSSMGQTWPAASLPGLDLARDAGDVTLELRRDAGTIVLQGEVRRRRAFGLFDFTPNPDYARQAGAAPGRRAMSASRLFALAVHDVGRAFIQQLEALGFKDLDLDDLLAMRIHGVTPEFITAMRQHGFDTLDHDDLVAARIHGATPAFVAGMARLGYAGIDFDDLIAFRIHGVTPDFIDEMAAAGYKALPAERLVEFRIHGVDAEFVKDLQERGYSGLSARELVEARIHGRRWMRKRGGSER